MDWAKYVEQKASTLRGDKAIIDVDEDRLVSDVIYVHATTFQRSMIDFCARFPSIFDGSGHTKCVNSVRLWTTKGLALSFIGGGYCCVHVNLLTNDHDDKDESGPNNFELNFNSEFGDRYFKVEKRFKSREILFDSRNEKDFINFYVKTLSRN